MKNITMTPEQADKFRVFQRKFNKFDWFTQRETYGAEVIALMRQMLEASGFDFENIDHIDRFMKEIIEPEWVEFGRKEKELIDKMRAEFIAAGATEAQLTWGLLNNVRLDGKAKRRVEKIARKIDDLRTEILPIMGLAAVLNEAREKLAEG